MYSLLHLTTTMGAAAAAAGSKAAIQIAKNAGIGSVLVSFLVSEFLFFYSLL
jgi:LDH2 family malate/lactate/ureidoglycolate dehydrogenase